MKELNFEQMENVQGGASVNCILSCAGAFVFGTGGLIAAAGSCGAAIGFAIAANLWGWGMAAYACS